MRSAGEYRTRFAWAVHSYGAPSDLGDPTDEYAAPVNLWGGYDGDRVRSTVPDKASEQMGTTARLRFRNHLAIAPLDALTDEQTGEVWTVDVVGRGDNETIADVSR